MTAQFVDGFVFITLYLHLGLGVPFMICLQTIVYGYFFRFMAVLLDTPFFYLAIYGIKRYLGIELRDNSYVPVETKEV